MVALSTPKPGMYHITVSGVSTLKNGKPTNRGLKSHTVSHLELLLASLLIRDK